jgi:hypothetical protein
LPLDVLGVIAEQLIDENAFGTCAALNVTCHAVEEETSPTLWKTCVLPGAQAFKRFPPSTRIKAFGAVTPELVAVEAKMHEEWEGLTSSTRAKYIRYVERIRAKPI